MVRPAIAALLTAVLACAGPARSYVHGGTSVAHLAQNCPTYDTTVLTYPRGAMLIANCRINTGKYGTVLATLTGQITCGNVSDGFLEMVAAVGQPLPPGANFNGSISGGVLTVSSMITPAQFIITPGSETFLFDASSGANIPAGANGSTLTVTSQIDGTQGLTGHYAVSDNTVTVGSEVMWSGITYAGAHPTGTIFIGRDPLEQTACQNGKQHPVTMAGGIRPGDFAGNNLDTWIGVVFVTESIGGHNPQSASWTNGQITMMAPN